MKKRLMSMLISVAVIASGITPVFAATLTKEQIANSVKTKLDVPAEYTEFTIDYHVDSEGETAYWIRWINEDGDDRGNINVSCDSYARIQNISIGYYNDREPVLIKDSRKKVLEIIEQKLIKLVPECFNDGDTYSVDSSSLDMNGNGTASYIRYRDSIPVWNNTITVNFEYIDGDYEITHLSVNHDYDAVFGEITDRENIKENYMKLAENELEYSLIYEYDKEAHKGKRIPVLRYVVKDAPFMNPVTGEEMTADINTDYELYKYATADMGSAETALAMGVLQNGLSQEEIAEIDKVNNLKSADECAAILKSISELYVDDEMTVESSRLYKSDEKYYIELSLSDKESSWCSAKLNAETGKIVSFYNVDDTIKHDKDAIELTEDDLKGAVGGEDFLKKYADGFENYVLDEKTGHKTGGDYICNETYIKLVNGIPFTGADAGIAYNTETNRVYSMNINERKHDGEFPDPSKAISEEQAFETAFAIYPLERVFVKSDGMYKTAYVISSRNALVDAIDNVVVNHNNTPVEPKEDIYTYNDIAGHWAEETINHFAQFGIGFEGESFKPDEPISWEEFTELMNKVGIYRSVEDFDKSGDFTREKAAALIVSGMGFERVAKLQGIFTAQFTDEAEIAPEFLGSCAIAKGMGIVSGMDGKFCPKKTVTRAEALMMMYNYKTNY